ncbi:SixA phosphatase family protein [Botryobacter ruber]|uniref:SixA phosphatase family protein n=1 Tax=Botryobacter ruber TaxID=2171629 RepID=UPI000E0AFB70|nr:histidine phosphatase family protein [Botryobacter ruber]
MQRHILICRHAETEDPYPFQPDFERELTQDGILQAHQTGHWIRDHFSKVDLILASPANRTRATTQILADKVYYAHEEIKYEPELYNGREPQLMQALSELPDKVKAVLLVAHNPGVTQLVRHLSGKRIPYLEPAEAVAVAVDLSSWTDIYITEGEIVQRTTS